jgi:hypothetical protein
LTSPQSMGLLYMALVWFWGHAVEHFWPDKLCTSLYCALSTLKIFVLCPQMY